MVDTYGNSRRLHAALLGALATLRVAAGVACSLASASGQRATPPEAAVEVAGPQLATASGETLGLRGEPSPALYPQLIIVSADGARDGARITLPYDDALVAAWAIADETKLGILERDDAGEWMWSAAIIDPATNMAAGETHGGEAWAVGPSWMMKPWQRRRVLGSEFRPGERNVLIVHGWNSEPWDACMLALAGGLSRTYANVAAVAYPSAFDITESANWLRTEIETRWPETPFDVVAFSEGGLVARAALEAHSWNGSRVVAANVERLITIATPHEALLDGAPPSILDDVANQQMRAGSSFLRELASGEAPAGTAYHLMAGDTGAGHDSIVTTESALARATLSAKTRTTLRLPHSPGRPGGRGLPCDEQVYDLINKLP